MLFLFQNCTKPKTVLICGDHVCINKVEANQYFEENLSIEVRIIGAKKNSNPDLVELNLNSIQDNDKKISIQQKENTNKEVKVLTNEEIIKIKKEIKKKEKNKFIVKKIDKKKKILNKSIIQKNSIKVDNKEKKKVKTTSIKKIESSESKKLNTSEIIINKKRKNVVDVCTIIEKCSIDEISKYLIKQGNNKKFPDITTRE